MRHAVRQAMVVLFRQIYRDIGFTAHVDFFQRDRDAHFVVVAGYRETFPAATARIGAAARREAFQNVSQIHIVEGRRAGAAVAFLLFGRHIEPLSGRMLAQVAILSPLFSILQRGVGFGDFLEFLFGFRLAGNIRMISVRKLAVRLLDLVP
jgi:hypothetical protein